MGLLVAGKWHTDWYDTTKHQGAFVRKASSFRNWITLDGDAGPTGGAGFKAQAGRYHLYLSLACPWAHRTLIYLKLKGLEEMISVSIVDAYMGEEGWRFNLDLDPCYDHVSAYRSTPDRLFNYPFLHQIYTRAQADYTGRVTVPVLWDKQRNTIVNNESSEIIRMLNSAFDHLGATPIDLYPPKLQAQIDKWNDFIYPTINNGVYRAGFATTQAAYNEAVEQLFNALDQIETHLASQRYLTGNTITEADWRLFTTLVRFDAVYVGHFKCNIQQIAQYRHLFGYLRDLFQQPGIAQTVNFSHIKAHYYRSHSMINPTGIIPKGPIQDLMAPHGRK